MNKGKARKIVNNVIVHVILAILAIIWLFPIFWVIMTSFRKERGAYTSYFFPKQLTFDNYIKLFTDTGMINPFFHAWYQQYLCLVHHIVCLDLDLNLENHL